MSFFKQSNWNFILKSQFKEDKWNENRNYIISGGDLKCSEDFICVDINECDEDRPGTIACGENANCINTIGSFECECHDGYDNFIYGYGCSSGTSISFEIFSSKIL